MFVVSPLHCSLAFSARPFKLKKNVDYLQVGQNYLRSLFFFFPKISSDFPQQTFLTWGVHFLLIMDAEASKTKLFMKTAPGLSTVHVRMASEKKHLLDLENPLFVFSLFVSSFPEVKFCFKYSDMMMKMFSTRRSICFCFQMLLGWWQLLDAH